MKKLRLRYVSNLLMNEWSNKDSSQMCFPPKLMFTTNLVISENEPSQY